MERSTATASASRIGSDWCAPWRPTVGILTRTRRADLHKTWVLRRALYDGPVTTRSENPLVWRIVTHDSGDSKPFNPLTDKLPPRSDGPVAFRLKENEMPRDHHSWVAT